MLLDTRPKRSDWSDPSVVPWLFFDGDYPPSSFNVNLGNLILFFIEFEMFVFKGRARILNCLFMCIPRFFRHSSLDALLIPEI